MKRPGLIALDLDGTLLDGDEQVTPRASAAIGALTEAGTVVALATGRPARMTTAFVHELGLEYAIVYNGAGRYEASSRSVHVHHALDREHALGVVRRLRARLPGIRLGLETAHGWYLDEALEARRRAHPRLASMTPPDGVGDVASFVRDAVIKVFARHPEQGADEMAQVIADLDVYATWTRLEMLEIMHAQVNKRHAVEALATSLGIARTQVAAFGDQHNDLEVLAWAGYGVAPANASEAARAAADEITASHEEDGVARVLERWL